MDLLSLSETSTQNNVSAYCHLQSDQYLIANLNSGDKNMLKLYIYTSLGPLLLSPSAHITFLGSFCLMLFWPHAFWQYEKLTTWTWASWRLGDTSLLVLPQPATKHFVEFFIFIFSDDGIFAVFTPLAILLDSFKHKQWIKQHLTHTQHRNITNGVKMERQNKVKTECHRKKEW